MGIRAMDGLETLYIICDRFSHSIRTHLGVSMGVVDDLLSGYELGQQEFTDAKRALQAILKTLDSVRDVTNKPAFDPEPQSLKEFIESSSQSNFGLDPDLHLLSQTEFADDKPSNFDRKLLWRAIRCLFRYSVLRGKPGEPVTIELHRMPLQPESGRILPASFAENVGDFEWCIRVHFLTAESASLTKFTDTNELTKLAAVDQSAESLGLLYVEQVMLLHTGASFADLAESENAFWLFL